ncbi:hypothetical protein FO519_000397 [Halicephalobus sp. NKZ332]|nr:hypothetical protein FO519_000397 [Halicephalobus sp. NKZ332]
MSERIQVSSNVELKDKVIDHGVDLLNMNQLSNSQRRELQRFIDTNAHLLNISDREREEREKKEKKQGRYSGPGSAALSFSGSDYGSGKRLNFDKLGSLNRIGSPSSEYGTGKRKEVSWSDGVRAKSHSPTFDDSSRRRNRDGFGDPDYLRNQGQRYPHDQYSSLDRDRDNKARERRSPSWGKPWVGNLGSKEDVSSSGKPWHTYLKDRENSPAYSTLQRHPDDYNRYETRKYIVKELEKTRRDDTAKFYGFGDRVGSGIELTPKRWAGGQIISDPTFLKKSLKPRRLFYSPIGDGVVEADGVEMKRGPKDMTPRRYVTHEKFIDPGSGGHDGVNIYETRWAEGDDDDGNRNDKGYSGPPFDDLGDRNRGPKSDDGWPRSGRSSALSIGTDGFPRHGWTKTFIVNPRELINQYGTETTTNIFDLEDHTPKTLTTTTEVISNDVYEEPLV